MEYYLFIVIGMPFRISLPNCIFITRSAAELWRLINFSRWRPYSRKSTSGFRFRDGTRSGKWTSVCIPNFDNISHSGTVLPVFWGWQIMQINGKARNLTLAHPFCSSPQYAKMRIKWLDHFFGSVSLQPRFLHRFYGQYVKWCAFWGLQKIHISTPLFYKKGNFWPIFDRT